MGVFDDKKFEGLDWISQATEPIDSVMNDILGTLPDEVNIDFNLYVRAVCQTYGLDLDLSRFIQFIIKEYVPNAELSYSQHKAIVDCFKLDMTGEEVILDFENKAIVGGEIKLIKLNATMDEKVLESMLGKEGIDAVTNCFISQSGLSRANEVMEILGKCQEGLGTRSERKKRIVMKKRLDQLFKTNEWKIKDTELANKIGFWIRDYIKDGDIGAFSNFCRLKVMTHKDQPIYSMEEIK